MGPVFTVHMFIIKVSVIHWIIIVNKWRKSQVEVESK